MSLTDKITTHELKSRIRKGKAWLETHSQDMCSIILGEKYDHARYEANLHFYEELVDEAKSRGISEQECWNYESNELTTNGMTTEEIAYEFIKPDMRQGALI